MSHMPYETQKLLHHMPADSETGAVNTDWKSLVGFHAWQFLLSVGDIQATGTLDVAVEQATDATGTGAKALTDKDGNAIVATQLTAADGDDAITLASFTEYMDVSNGYTHIRVTVTPATAASEFAGFLFGIPRFVPVDFSTDWKEVVGP